MGLLIVDQGLCQRDGICAEVCPVSIIEFKEKDAFPTLIDGGEKLCIRCGHCVAVCPHGAMTHAIMRPDECLSVHDDWVLSPERVEHFLRYRRSIRNYKNKQVDREVLTNRFGAIRAIRT